MMTSYGTDLPGLIKQHGSVHTAVFLDGPMTGERLLWSGQQILWCQPDQADRWKRLIPQLNDTPICQISILANAMIFVEQLVAMPKLVILGGGHISLAICPIGKIIGFHVTVVDDREEYANNQRFPMADDVICADFAHAIAQIPDTANTYYVIVTRGHAADALCAERLLRRDFAYLGMIGSRTKVAKTRSKLADLGFSAAELDRMHAPIGLPIGGETPGEIAVSIAAEIVQTKNQVKRSELPLDLLAALTATNEPAVLATIIEKTGSSPRGNGSRMLVNQEGLVSGTIGGGAVEMAAIEKARAMLETGEDFAVERYDLSDSASASLGMICGGRNQVLFERV